MTRKEAAAILLKDFDKHWTKSMSIETHNARQKAERDGHKCRVIDREGFRAALIEVINLSL